MVDKSSKIGGPRQQEVIPGLLRLPSQASLRHILERLKVANYGTLRLTHFANYGTL